MWRLVALLALALGGCASFGPPFVPEFDRGPDTPKKYVYVDHRWQMDVLCGVNGEKGNKLGCAFTPKSADGICVIILYRNGPAESKVHEDDHCQYGRYHP